MLGLAVAARMAVLVCLVHVLCVRSAVDTHASRAIACSVIGSTGVLASVLYVKCVR